MIHIYYMCVCVWGKALFLARDISVNNPPSPKQDLLCIPEKSKSYQDHIFSYNLTGLRPVETPK